MTPFLDVSGLAVQLGGRTVLKSTDLTVDRGELVGLLGPNGAGKTTLLRAILGLVRPLAGTIAVEGGDAVRSRTRIGYVPQRHEFAWEFPIAVDEAVMSGRAGHLGLLRRPGVADWQAVDRALDRVRMTDLRDRPVGELSGGQRQRVLVARALALEPTTLLLDEPFTGLDLPTQELLADLCISLAREDRAVLMTTHDLSSAIYTCDRLVLLNGTVVATGAPRTLAREVDAWRRTFGVSDRSPLLRLLGSLG